MKFSVGDKVVHPHRGPGRIVDVERKEFVKEEKRYYVIETAIQAYFLVDQDSLVGPGVGHRTGATAILKGPHVNGGTGDAGITVHIRPKGIRRKTRIAGINTQRSHLQTIVPLLHIHEEGIFSDIP